MTISASLITGSVDSGLGRHDYYLTPQEQRYSMKLNLIANPFGIMSYSLPNVSVAIFLNRILTLDTCRKWFIFAVVIIENIVAAISAILSYVQCPPFNFFWGASSTAACVRPQVVAIYCEFASGTSNIFHTSTPFGGCS